LDSPRYKLDLGKLIGDSIELYKRNFATFCVVGAFLLLIPGFFYIASVLSSPAILAILARGADGLAPFLPLFLVFHIILLWISVNEYNTTIPYINISAKKKIKCTISLLT